MKIYEGCTFSVYLKKFLDKKGIKQVKVAQMLNISYDTFISKIRRDSFKYHEVLFLEVALNLNYVSNFHEYLKLRGFENE